MTHRNRFGYPEINVWSYYKEPSLWDRGGRFYVIAFLIATLILCITMFSCSRKDNDYAWAEPIYTDTQLVHAIYHAEGGERAQFAYGIRSVRYSTKDEARRICLNTIRNNRKRFLKQSKHDDFLEFLASRYAPKNAKNDPKKLNRFWLQNVRYHLGRTKCQ